MTAPSIYINLEDDVSKVVTRIKKEKNSSLVLVCPKRCFLFNDSINLKLLKKQTDLLQKEVFILTMDERGQTYAKEAGFGLKFLPQAKKSSSLSDIAERPNNQVLNPKPANFQATQGLRPTADLPAKTAQSVIPKIEVKDSVFPKEADEAYKINKKKALNHKIIYGLLSVCLLTIAALVILVLPKAKVVVFAKSETVTRDIEIAISTLNQTPNVSKLLLPARKVNDKLEVSNKFVTQGKKEVGSKASGLVRIYNFTKLPLNLKAPTTSFTLGNKTYLLVKDAMGVKPTTYKNAKTKEIEPSSLSETYEIIAAEGGESYNIPAGTRIEVSNQVFGSKPLLLYAKSETPISGGNSRYLSVISEQDLNQARTLLGEALLRQLNEKLALQDLSVAEKAYSLEDVAFSADKPAGTESPNFNAKLSATVVALAYNRQEMENLIFERIKQTITANKSLEPISQGQISYKLKSLDLASESGIISAHYEGNVFYNIDLRNVTKQLRGKSQNQVNEILRSKADIDEIEITLAPSWQKTFPLISQRIEISIQKPVSKTHVLE